MNALVILLALAIGYIILGCLFQGVQTALTALGWYGILRYAYPGGVSYTGGGAAGGSTSGLADATTTHSPGSNLPLLTAKLTRLQPSS